MRGEQRGEERSVPKPHTKFLAKLCYHFFVQQQGGERIQRQFRGHCRHVTTPILLPFFSFCNIFQLPRARREGAGAFPLPANRNLRQEVTCKGESCPVFTSTHQTLRIFVRCLQSQRWGFFLQRRLFFRNISWQFPVPYILLLSGVLLLPCLLFPRRILPPPSLRSAVVEAPTIIVIMLSSSFSLPPFLLGQGREGDPSLQQQQLATTTHPLPPSPQPTSAAPSRGGLDGTTTFPLPLSLSHFFPLSPSPKRRDRRRRTRGCRPVVSLLP